MVGRFTTRNIKHCYVSSSKEEENAEGFNIEKQLARFWELEECTAPIQEVNKVKSFCKSHFIEKTTREDSGRFVVRLPFLERIV